MNRSLLFLMTVFSAARVLACAPHDDESSLGEGTSFQSKGEEEEDTTAADPFATLRERATKEQTAEPVKKDRPVLVWTVDGAEKPTVIADESALTLQVPDPLRSQMSLQLQSNSDPIVAFLMTMSNGLTQGQTYACADAGGQIAFRSAENQPVWRTKRFPDTDCSVTIDVEKGEDILGGVPARTRYEGHFEGRVFDPEGKAHEIRAAFIVFSKPR